MSAQNDAVRALAAAWRDSDSPDRHACADDLDDLFPDVMAERGEQAVAFVAQDGAPTWLHDGRGLGSSSAQPVGTMLYTHPQPVAVAGGGLLSSRLRGGVECAPWVIEEVRKLEAALSAAPAAPETDAVLIGQAVCYGGDSDGGGNWFKELTVEGVTFLAPLDDHQRAIHILAAKKRRKQEAAPAPVAGDAVAKLLQAWDTPPTKAGPGWIEKNTRRECAHWMRAALAQDRASQAGEAGGVS